MPFTAALNSCREDDLARQQGRRRSAFDLQTIESPLKGLDQGKLYAVDDRQGERMAIPA